jgi:hypothetical protein
MVPSFRLHCHALPWICVQIGSALSLHFGILRSFGGGVGEGVGWPATEQLARLHVGFVRSCQP